MVCWLDRSVVWRPAGYGIWQTWKLFCGAVCVFPLYLFYCNLVKLFCVYHGKCIKVFMRVSLYPYRNYCLCHIRSTEPVSEDLCTVTSIQCVVTKLYQNMTASACRFEMVLNLFLTSDSLFLLLQAPWVSPPLNTMNYKQGDAGADFLFSSPRIAHSLNITTGYARVHVACDPQVKSWKDRGLYKFHIIILQLVYIPYYFAWNNM